MTTIDWTILGIYIIGVVLLGFAVGRSQKDQDDYYLGSRRMKTWQVGLSLMANQVSAISLIGAPAFIATRSGGGLVWLQYEFAVPLAMIAIMLFLVPVFHRVGGITIYEYLERRFGGATRSALSLVFLVSRGLGAGVVLLATSIVTSVCLGIDLPPTILLIGLVALLYTTIGGIKADIYSDIIQLFVLWSSTIIVIVILIYLLGDRVFDFPAMSAERLRVYDLRSTGFGDNRSFGFWPMLFGGFFLYISYYGCDQSQAQRLLTTGTPGEARRALLWNGLLRFPLVATYCFFGVLLIPFLASNEAFAIKMQSVRPDFLVPYFLIEYVPKGFLGIIVAGIFAASMSSIDSVLNSLSAASWKDFLEKYLPFMKALEGRRKVAMARALTFFWGSVATLFALLMAGGSETVLELINKIGSVFYGPIFGVFFLGIFTHRTGQKAAVAGLFGGAGINIYLWLFQESAVSWLWWNLIGFLGTVAIGLTASLFFTSPNVSAENDIIDSPMSLVKTSGSGYYSVILVIAFLAILLFCYGVQIALASLAG